MPTYLPDAKSGVDFLARIGLGNVVGYSRVAGIGATQAVAAAPYDVWEGALASYPWMSSATALEVVSSSAQDALAGTGVATVRITGLDANYAQVVQTLTLNGTTPVAVPIPLLRINDVRGMTKGSGAPAFNARNVGDVTVQVVGGGAGTQRAFMAAGTNFARQSQYTVPAGNSLQIIFQDFGLQAPANTRSASFTVFTGDSTGVGRLTKVFPVGQFPTAVVSYPGLTLPEKTDFGYVITELSTASIRYYASWVGFLKLNTAL